MDLMLATNFGDISEKAVDGWWISEKLDGQRAIWCPKRGRLVSRVDIPINLPPWLDKLLQCCPYNIEGELYLGRNTFQQTGLFRNRSKSNKYCRTWRRVRFCLFDLMDEEKAFCDRYQILKELVEEMEIMWWEEIYPQYSTWQNIPTECPITLVEQKVFNSSGDIISTDKYCSGSLYDIYNELVAEGAEGVIIRDPEAKYVRGRTRSMLKWKLVYHAEGIIVGYKMGNGKNDGRLGSFVVEPLNTHSDGKRRVTQRFHLSGMSDRVRRNYEKTHPVGVVVSYSYDSINPSGKPRFPRYRGKRGDVLTSVTGSTPISVSPPALVRV